MRTELLTLPDTIRDTLLLLQRILVTGDVYRVELDLEEQQVRVTWDPKEYEVLPKTEPDKFDIQDVFRKVRITERLIQHTDPLAVLFSSLQIVTAEGYYPYMWITGDIETLRKRLSFSSLASIKKIAGLLVFEDTTLPSDSLFLLGTRYRDGNIRTVKMILKVPLKEVSYEHGSSK